MYSQRTEFLTRKGWKLHSEMTTIDEIGNYGQRGKVEWIPHRLCNMQLTERPIDLHECQVGKSGKFCITEDHPIRFFHYSKGEEITIQHSLSQIITKLEKLDYLPGHIPTTFSTSLDTDTPEGNTAMLLSLMFKSIYRIDNEGNIYFAISRSLSQREIIDFLLKKANIKIGNIEAVENNTKVKLKGWKLRDLIQAVIYTPYVLTRVINDMLHQTNSKNTCTRILRFYCHNLATLAQIATSFGGRNSKIIFDEVQKGGNYALIVEPKDGSVSFRNRVVVLPDVDKAVSTSIQHPITRYDGRIAAL